MGVEPEAVDAHAHPVVEYLEDLVLHQRRVVVEVGLVVEEAVPVVLLGPRGPHVQLLVSVSVKMMRTSGYFSSVSLQT